MEKINKKAECIKQVSNFTNIATNLRLDNSKFDVKVLEKILPEASPKIEEMFKNIDTIDPNKKYKHCIYIDFKGVHAKIVAAAFIAKGYTLAYDKKQKQMEEDNLLKTKGKNFLFLSSSAIYGKPFGVRLRKSLMSIFNSRPDNIEGELIRFIVLDSGFKEGLDCFDIKYVHILQNLTTPSEEKQAVGRSTRMCGQMGLKFDSKKGWPLHVYKYDIILPDNLKELYNADTLYNLYLKNTNIDIRKIVLANQFEEILSEAAVDKELTKSIHSFSISNNSGPSSSSIKPVPPKNPRPDTIAPRPKIRTNPYSEPEINNPAFAYLDESSSDYRDSDFSNPKYDNNPVYMNDKYSRIGSDKRRKIDLNIENNINPLFSISSDETPPKYKKHDIHGGVIQSKIKGHPHPPTIKRTLNGSRKFISKHFYKFKWDDVILENKCISRGGANGEPEIVDFTPSQNFLRYYFQPQSVYKGMLANWSTGSGKTCLGVALASTSWEKKGYTILWVTRHTLKVDIWKNMFNQVCSLVVKDQIEKGDLKYPLKKGLHTYRTKEWMDPISFKQLSNLCQGKNDIYREMVKRNGSKDPLRKTLIILDEAHKLFSNDVTGSERPDTPAIVKSIQDSYKHSKEDSVRIFLMTATPYTSDPMDFINLMNIIREENDQIPNTFDEFSDRYLMDNGKFKESPKEEFMNKIAGQISYLNREKDARQFAYPIFHSINVPMSISDIGKSNEDLEKSTLDLNNALDENKKDKDKLKEEKSNIKNEKKTRLERCKEVPVKQRKECKDRVALEIKALEEKDIIPLNKKIKLDENKVKELKENIKKIKKNKKKFSENDISQETALKKCIPQKDLEKK